MSISYVLLQLALCTIGAGCIAVCAYAQLPLAAMLTVFSIWCFLLLVCMPASHRLHNKWLREKLHRVGEVAVTPIILYFAMLLCFAVLIGLLFLSGVLNAEAWQRNQYRWGFAFLCSVALLYLYCTIAGSRIHVQHYHFHTTKPLAHTLRLVLLSDLHLGFVTQAQSIRKIAHTINTLSADLVVISGDLFDYSYEALHAPQDCAAALRAINSRYGIYACEGNHDLFCQDERKNQLLTAGGITLLRDQGVTLACGVHLHGRKDLHNPSRQPRLRLCAEAQPQYTVVLDHNPLALESSLAQGADLVLCGHTHGGQSQPLALCMRSMYPLLYGKLSKKDANAVVTSGAGLWGGPMRLGVKREIVLIEITSQQTKDGVS